MDGYFLQDILKPDHTVWVAIWWTNPLMSTYILTSQLTCLLQVYLIGIFRLIGMYYATVFQGIVMKHKANRKLYKWAVLRSRALLSNWAYSYWVCRVNLWYHCSCSQCQATETSDVECGCLYLELLGYSVHWPVVEILAIHFNLIAAQAESKYATDLGDDYKYINCCIRGSGSCTSYIGQILSRLQERFTYSATPIQDICYTD